MNYSDGGGCLSAGDPTYIERDADRELLENLKSGESCYVFNARQTGKSSLRVRTAEELKKEGWACVSVNLQNIGGSSTTIDEFYGGFLECLIKEKELDININLNKWIEDNRNISPVQWVKKAIDLTIIPKLINDEKNLVIFIDEIDNILAVIDFSLDDFWGLIKSCYETEKLEYGRIQFVTLGATTPKEISSNKHSILNIGKAIELPGFTSLQMRQLLLGLYPKPSNIDIFLNKIHEYTGGQPFLTQKVFKRIQESSIINVDNLKEIEALIENRIITNWEYEDRDNPEHLRTIQDRLLDNKFAVEILILYKKILENQQIVYNESNFIHQKLRLSGIVVKEGNILRIYNKIYKQVFNLEWTITQLKNKGYMELENQEYMGRYQIIKRIGQGGFGETYLVKDLNIEGQPLRTLKKLTPPSGLNNDQLKNVQDNFRREAKNLATLNHDRIPSVFDYFMENDCFFIVQTYIEGETLEQELRELTSNHQITEDKIIEILEEILEIISFVHRQGVLHRDIKPSNLIRRDTNNKLVLIDFGSGKNIQGNIPTQSKPTLALGTDGYTPDEQWNSRAVESSDLYAIGIIGIQAIVDIIPSQYWLEKNNAGDLIWHNRDKIGASEDLKKVLNKMTCSRAEDRYQSAQEVLDKLGELKAKRKKLLQIALKRRTMWRNTKVSGVFIMAMTALGIGLGLGSIKKLWGDRVDFNTYISSGDRPISLYESNTKEQENGINYFNSKNYLQAYNTFYQLLSNHKSSFDPSLMIYMNNAKVRYLHQQNPNKPIHTIAVTVPTDTPVGKQIVSGVAIAQNEVVNPGSSDLPPDIKKESDIYLEIIIANDRNIRNNAAQLAEKLTKTITGEDGIQRSIIAIVGSYTSEVTCEALPVYSQANIPMISPTSSVENLKSCGDPNNVFHRTITSSKLESERLIEGLKSLGDLQKIKITAFYKKGGSHEFSQDLFNHFNDNLKNIGGKIDNEYNLLEDNNYREIVQKIEDSNTQNVILLFPDGGTENMLVFDRAQKVIENINPSKISLILGSNPLLASTNVIKLQDLNKKLLVAVDWSDDRECSKESFVNQIRKTIKGDFNRHIVSSYESTMALAEIFKDGANTPKAINDRLKNFRSKNYSAASDNRYIGFHQNGDRAYIEHKILLTPTATLNRRGIIFKPLPGQCKP